MTSAKKSAEATAANKERDEALAELRAALVKFNRRRRRRMRGGIELPAAGSLGFDGS
jgi:hypothetical protein